MNKLTRLLAATVFLFSLFTPVDSVSQTVFTPRVGVEVSFPKNPIVINPSFGCHRPESGFNFIVGVDGYHSIAEDWMLGMRIYWTKYSIESFYTCDHRDPSVMYHFNNLRTGIGAKFMAFPDVYLGMGFSLDYQYNHNNPQLDINANFDEFNNIKDLGVNLSLEYVLDRVSFSIIFNKGLWTLGDLKTRGLMGKNRPNRPLASIGLYFGYRLEFD
jgi:hypothetical protein